jgi:uncharacterized MAPEG superfamily protein
VSLSHWALLGFVTWTLLLVIVGVGTPRIWAVLRKGARPNAFNPEKPHGSERYQRTMRAHLNCVENLPVFAALVLLGSQLAVPGALFQIAAFIVLPARVLQSTAHIASGQNRAVLARFAFFSIQMGCFALLIALLVAHAFRTN